jgi:UDP-glucose 4-epimerase
LRYLLTGCAGFIGSTLTDKLLACGHEVVGYDNFSTGQERFLFSAREQPKFTLVRGDVLDAGKLMVAMRGVDCVIHLAANADVRFGAAHPEKDLQQNTLATHTVLQSMRASGVQRIAFASSGSVYGEAQIFPTPENAPLPIQTSLYGASKLAAEGLITAYAAAFGIRCWIFRFVSILGERYSHGHVIDFYRQLSEHPDRLYVLGNGHQRKSYLHVQDCVDAMVIAMARVDRDVNLFNVGHDAHCEVNESIGWICTALGVSPRIEYTGGERGWVGDNPFIHLDTRRIRALGWWPTLSIRQSVIRTLDYLKTQDSVAVAMPGRVNEHPPALA